MHSVDDVVDESDDNDETEADTENDSENEEDEKDHHNSVILQLTHTTAVLCSSDYFVKIEMR